MGIFQQIGLCSEHHDLLCSVEPAPAKPLILNPNWRLTLFIETTKARKKTSTTVLWYRTKRSCWGSERSCSCEWSWLCAHPHLPPFHPDSSQTVPHSSQTYTQDAVGFWSWKKHPKVSAKPLHAAQRTPVLSGVVPKSSAVSISLFGKRLHEYQRVWETGNNE